MTVVFWSPYLDIILTLSSLEDLFTQRTGVSMLPQAVTFRLCISLDMHCSGLVFAVQPARISLFLQPFYDL
jgi:hypothetical protein